MTLGTAARLQVLTALASKDSSIKTPNYDDDSSRCYWSIYVLEKTLSPQITLLDQISAPPYPLSTSCPPPLVSQSVERPPNSIDADSLCVKDHGIDAYGIQTISIWGDIISYIHRIRHGTPEVAWLPTSTFSQLLAKMQEFEVGLVETHLFHNVSVLSRSPADLINHQEYWVPWFTMQITSHAAQAVLHHPFVHLVALRDKSRISQPRSFLQQTVDQALFHAGWVIRLLQISENLNQIMDNPLTGHLVAATALIPWLFQFSQDASASAKAREGLFQCERVLSRVSNHWPHIAHKVGFKCLSIDKIRRLTIV